MQIGYSSGPNQALRVYESYQPGMEAEKAKRNWLISGTQFGNHDLDADINRAIEMVSSMSRFTKGLYMQRCCLSIQLLYGVSDTK